MNLRLQKVVCFHKTMQRFNIRAYVSSPSFWQRKKVIGGLIGCFTILVLLPLFFFWYGTHTVEEAQKPITAKEIVPPHVPGQLIVAFKDGESPDNFFKTAPKEFGFTGYEKVFPKETADSLKNYYLLKFSKQESIESVKIYVQKRREVRSVGFNKLMSFDAIPPTPFSVNDSLVGNQWALGAIDIGQAWSVFQKTPIQTEKKVIVGIIDSGVDYNHEDLSNGQVIKGGDFATDHGARTAPGKSGDPMDVFGHGTAIAGIIGATTNNRKGIAGIAGVTNSVSLLAVKVGNSAGIIGQADSLTAISSVIADGAKVVNLSFGAYTACSDAYQQLFDAHKDVVFVAAAGNGLCRLSNGVYVNAIGACPAGSTRVGVDISIHGHDPASCNGVIAVASVDESYIPTITSNWGKKVTLAAPGVSIATTRASMCSLETCGPVSLNPLLTNYVLFNGTSFAAPYVSGVAALLLAKYPALTSAQVKECLVKSGENIVRARQNQPVGPLLDVGNAIRDCPAILARSGETTTPRPSVSVLPTQTPTPSPVAIVEIKDGSPVGDPGGKLICSPVGGMGNKLNANAIQVTNGTGADVVIWYQSNLCDYAQNVALIEGYQCNTFRGRANYTLSKGQTKIFTLNIPSCTVGQLDINVANPSDKGCYRPDDTSKLWDGGLAFAIQANKNTCQVLTPTSTAGVGSHDSAGFIRDGSTPIPTPTPRICTQPQVYCSNNRGNVQMCSFTC